MPSTEFSPLFSGQITCYGWRNSVIKIHPWVGTGLGTFGWAFPRYRGDNIFTSRWSGWDLLGRDPAGSLT
jgi:hypothetical protein